jgi:hypothetical protein
MGRMGHGHTDMTPCEVSAHFSGKLMSIRFRGAFLL